MSLSTVVFSIPTVSALLAISLSLGSFLAEAAFFPKINLLAFIGAETMESGSFFTKPAMVGGFGASLAAPLFQGGRIQQNLEAVKAQHREATVAYLETLQTAFQETEDALVGAQKTFSNYQQQRNIQQAQEKTYGLQQSRMQQGFIGRVELLQARKALLQTQQQNLELRLKAFLEQLKLYKALGGGWAKKAQPRPCANEASISKTKKG